MVIGFVSDLVPKSNGMFHLDLRVSSLGANSLSPTGVKRVKRALTLLGLPVRNPHVKNVF